MKLIIRNLDRSTTEEQLRDLFKAFGVVQSCDLVMDKESKQSKGFAFIEMPKQGDGKAAMKGLNGKELDGSKIRVKKSLPKSLSDPDDKTKADE
jgi:RNA recognition motif-containing protein